MGTGIYRVFLRLGAVVTLSLTVLALAGCGTSTEPTSEPPAASQTEPAESEGSESASDTTPVEPEGDIAAKFTLPDATGDAVSLASFAGDKNVVLVFYRGFW